jgi:exonuclease SbcC
MIALRKIAKALSKGSLQLLILDEPTIHLDEERRRELAMMIKNLNSIPQTIVVTHDDEFDQVANTTIHVRKVDGASIIERG